MSDLKSFFEENPITYVDGKKDPTPVELVDHGKTVFLFTPVNGWEVKDMELKNGNFVITIGKDEPLTWDDFKF